MPRGLVLCAVLVAMSGCNEAGQEPVGTSTVSQFTSSMPTTTVAQSTDTTEPGADVVLQSMIETWVHQSRPVGVAAGARFPDGSLWLGATGLADRDQGIPVAVTDRFVIGSITKTFMAVLTMRLVEEDIVQLDETVSAYLPDFPAGGEMTIRDLLGHRAGVYDAYSEILYQGDSPPDPSRVFMPDELLAAAAAGTPTFPPGSAQEYSNSGYWVLGAVLEAATGTDAGSLLDSYVIDPLGLETTLLFDASLPDVEVVNAYADLDSDNETDSMGTKPVPLVVTPAWTAAGMISTVDDLLTFLDQLFAGELIAEESLREMIDLSNDNSPYAMGIFQRGSMWGHDGAILGYLSAVFHDVDTGVTVAVLVNDSSARPPDRLAQRIAASAGQLVK